MNERLNELSLELAQNEVNYKRLDGIAALIMERYEISNGISLALVIYSNLIGFGLTTTEQESVDVVTELINGYNSFELRDLAISLLSEEVVDHYKQIIELDYTILAGPMASMLKTIGLGLEETLEDFSEKYDSLEKILPKNN